VSSQVSLHQTRKNPGLKNVAQVKARTGIDKRDFPSRAQLRNSQIKQRVEALRKFAECQGLVCEGEKAPERSRDLAQNKGGLEVCAWKKKNKAVENGAGRVTQKSGARKMEVLGDGGYQKKDQPGRSTKKTVKT